LVSTQLDSYFGIIEERVTPEGYNGLDPAKWLLDTLEKLPTTKNKDLHTLLPLKNWNAV
jgi:hypothetical protein